MAIDANKSGMLHEHLQASNPVPLNSDDNARCDGHDRSTNRCRKVDAVVKNPGQWLVGELAWPESGRYASRVHWWQQSWLNWQRRGGPCARGRQCDHDG